MEIEVAFIWINNQGERKPAGKKLANEFQKNVAPEKIRNWSDIQIQTSKRTVVPYYVRQSQFFA